VTSGAQKKRETKKPKSKKASILKNE